MRNLLIAACAALVLSSCASTASKVDATLGKPTVQENVKWACAALQGFVNIAAPLVKVSSDAARAFALGRSTLATTCTAAREGHLQNAEDAYAVIMDVAGQIAAEIAKP